MVRRSTGKRVRFEVFERDHFTCQYCGGQPPEVVLVLDHITPVASGGDGSLANLITACEPCNQGKSDRQLGTARIRPDADLMYLAVQQEIAEMRRYQAVLAEREQVMGDVIATLQMLWCDVSELEWNPTDRIIRQLVNLRGFEIASDAIIDVAPKVASGYVNESRFVPYLFAVAKSMAMDRGDIPDDRGEE